MLDVRIALLLELGFVLDDLRAAGVDQPVHVVQCALEAESHASRLAPNPDLRAWCAGLDGGKPHEVDELPELVLSARLAQRLTPGQPLDRRLAGDRLLPLAVGCERAAGRHGRTMESWTVSAALRDLLR